MARYFYFAILGLFVVAQEAGKSYAMLIHIKECDDHKLESFDYDGDDYNRDYGCTCDNNDYRVDQIVGMV